MRSSVLLLALALFLLLPSAGTGHPTAMTPVPAASSAAFSPAMSSQHLPDHHAAPSSSMGTVPVPPHSQAYGRQPLTGPLAHFPHPQPQMTGAHVPAYSGHYYAGTYYTGVNITSTQLSATINVPLDVPSSNDFYYVLLSVWDDAGSYDQVGFANAAGDFGVTYSTTDYCASNYYYSPDAISLPRGVTYNFSMTLSGGNVNFNVTAPNGTLIFQLAQTTGGTQFVDSAFFSCYSYYFGGNITAYDYTDYEEVYQTNTNVPPYDFFFGENVADLAPISAFSVFTTPPLPGNISVLINGDNAVVANTPYNLALHQGTGVFVLESAFGAKSFIVQLQVDQVPVSSAVIVSIYQSPGGWPVSLSASSGTPPFTFTSTVTVPANTSQGNYTVGYAATDSSGDPNQLSAWFEVVPQLVVSVALSPHLYADVGQNISLTAKIGGGLGGLTFSWAGLPSGCGGVTQVIHCIPMTAGTYMVTASATDSGGDVAVSNPFALHVYPPPQVTVTAVPSVVDVNHSVQLFASASAGAGGFSYVWSGLPPGCHGSGSSFTCTPTAVGTFAVTSVVTDAAAYVTNSAPATVQVIATPQVAIRASVLHADVGQPVNLVGSGVGGIGGLTYSWGGLPQGCHAAAANVSCVFVTPGGYTVSLVGTDSSNVDTAAATVFLQISSEPIVVFRPPSGSIDLGQSITFAVQVTGGAPAYRYAYTSLPPGCTSTSLSGLTCRPTAAGVFGNLTVAVTDLNDWTVFALTNLTVYDPPVATLTATPGAVVQGGTVTFTASALGGAGGNAYAWTELPGGCTPAPSATITCAPNGLGSYNVSVQVTDANGMSANATVVLIVSPPPPLVSTDVWNYVGLAVIVVGIAVAAVLLVRRSRSARSDAEAAETEDGATASP